MGIGRHAVIAVEGSMLARALAGNIVDDPQREMFAAPDPKRRRHRLRHAVPRVSIAIPIAVAMNGENQLVLSAGINGELPDLDVGRLDEFARDFRASTDRGVWCLRRSNARLRNGAADPR